MITTILFTISAVCVINYLVLCIGLIKGKSINLPMPLLHVFDTDYSYTYVSSTALGYQVYFWATYGGII